MARRFKEWEADLRKQQERHSMISLSDVEETISFPDPTMGPNTYTSVIVKLGKDIYQAVINDDEFAPIFLRPFYTNHKEEFEDLLESLTKQTDLVVKASVTLFDAATSDAVPEATLERLKGNQVEEDAIAMIRETCERRFKSLLGMLVVLPLGIVETIDFTVDVCDKPLTIEVNQSSGDNVMVGWGNISAFRSYGSFHSDFKDAETAMYFTLNYEAIRIRIVNLMEQIARIE